MLGTWSYTQRCQGYGGEASQQDPNPVDPSGTQYVPQVLSGLIGEPTVLSLGSFGLWDGAPKNGGRGIRSASGYRVLHALNILHGGTGSALPKEASFWAKAVLGE